MLVALRDTGTGSRDLSMRYNGYVRGESYLLDGITALRFCVSALLDDVVLLNGFPSRL